MKKVTLLALALSFGLISYAQDSTATDKKNQDDGTRKYRSWSIGLDFGWSLLFGDFHSYEQNQMAFNNKFGGFDPGVTFNLQKWYSSAWGWRGRAGWMSYSGSQGIYAVQAKSTFRGDLSVQLNLSGIGERNRNKPDRKDAWIVNAGIGYTWSNAIVYRNGQEFLKLGHDKTNEFDFAKATEKQKAEKTHNTVYMPFGLEYRYRISERWDLKLAADFLWAMDDNFDGSVTTVKDEWATGGKDVQALAFGNTTNDFLGYFNFGANYHFSWFKPHNNPTPIIYMGPGMDPRVDKLVDDMDKIMTDKDNDGVSDYFDKEPDTPEGYMVYGGGQAVDQDKDGIPDEIDQDPYSTRGAKVDANGRELDADGDGVPDGADLEPNSKPGAFVNYQGVTIVDRIGGGSSASEAFLPMVYFDFDKANITTANYERLATVARFLIANPNAKVIVFGHTDKVGGEQYNYKLSDRRAKAAKMALVNDFGIDESRIEMVGKGKTQLWSKHDGINRRAEFQIKK